MDEEFKHTLFSMIKDLKDALKGGQDMDKEVKDATTDFVEEVAVESSAPVVESSVETSETVEQQLEDTFTQNAAEIVEETVEFVKKEE